MRIYSNPEREQDAYALTDVSVFELTAREVAELDEDTVHEYMKRHEFRLAAVNNSVREKMFDTMIEERGIEGGWFYQYGMPGCLPDSGPMGPYPTAKGAAEACRDDALSD